MPKQSANPNDPNTLSDEELPNYPHKIKAVAKIFGVHVKSIKKYEKLGILGNPPRRDLKYVRRYSDANLELFRQIAERLNILKQEHTFSFETAVPVIKNEFGI